MADYNLSVEFIAINAELWSIVNALEGLKTQHEDAKVTYLHFDDDGDLYITLEWSE